MRLRCRPASHRRRGLSISKCRTTPIRKPFTPDRDRTQNSPLGGRRWPGPRDRDPAIPCSSAQSSAVHAIGPAWSSVKASNRDAGAARQPMGRLDAGDATTQPVRDRATGVEPVPPRINPAATAAPVPDDEACGKCSRFSGDCAPAAGESNDGPESGTRALRACPA